MNRLVLHLGMGKTGTSALQVAFVRNRERLAAVGVDYPAHPEDETAGAFAVTNGNGVELADLLGSAIARNPVGLDQAEAGLRRLCTDVALSAAPVTLVSSELLYRFEPAHLRLLVREAERAGVGLTAAAYVRDIAPYFLSSYSERVKRNDYAGTFEEYIGGTDDFNRRSELFRPRIEALVEAVGSGVRILHYDSAAEDLFAAFRRDVLDLAPTDGWETPPQAVNRGLTGPDGRPIGLSRDSLALLEARFRPDVDWLNATFLGGRLDVRGNARVIDGSTEESDGISERSALMRIPRASIIVPTHNHDLTLPITIAAALGQTIPEIEVLIVGDGVTPVLRAAAEKLAAEDDRVRFLDLPKGDHHGEVHRDLAVREARSNAIFYLCDDDLLLPRHVENLLPLLDDHDLVQSRNGYMTQNGEVVLYPTDLADPEAVAWHLAEPPNNCVSITGTAHRRDTYLALDEGWTVTPPGYYPDHYMWRKFLRRPGARCATHPEMTAIQLPTSDGRDHLTQSERVAELTAWATRLLGDPEGHAWLQREVGHATARQLDRTYRRWLNAAVLANTRGDELAGHRSEIEKLEHELRLRNDYVQRLYDEFVRERDENRAKQARLKRMRSRMARLQAERATALADLAALHASRSWTVTAPLRAAAGIARRLRQR